MAPYPVLAETVLVCTAALCRSDSSAAAALLQQALVPLWPQACAENVKVARCGGAMTNVVFWVDLEGPHAAGVACTNVIVRVQAGGPSLFDRAVEEACFEAAATAGIGAQLLVKLGNGRVEEAFVGHRPLSPEDMRHPGTSASIAVQLARFHAHMTQAMLASQPAATVPASADIWERMHGWAAALQQAAVPGGCAAACAVAALPDKVRQLQQRLAPLSLWATLGHNDLQCGNILVPEAPGGHQAAIKLIDYDYACWSTPGFDLANHWCEWCAEYGPGGACTLDFFARRPTPEQQRAFSATYLHELLRLHGVAHEGSAAHGHTAHEGAALDPRLECGTAQGGACTGAAAAARQAGGGAGGGPQQPGSADGGFVRWLHTALACQDGAGGTEGRTAGGCGTDGASGGGLQGVCPAASSSSSAPAAGRARGAQGGLEGARLSLSRQQVERLVDVLCAAARAWEAASHLHWALWGLVASAPLSGGGASAIEFDYGGYALQRLRQYERLEQQGAVPGS